MKLHQITALVAITDAGSIRAAARQLNMSPAGLTKSLRELETDLRAPLVTRTSSGIILTQYGSRLVAHGRLVLGQIKRAQAEIDAMRGATEDKLSIGVTPWLALTFLSPAVNRFKQKMPNVQLEFFEGLLAVVQPRLRDGSLDFSIGRPSPASSNSEFQSTPLFSTHSAVVGRKGHPLGACRTLRELQNADWVLNWDPASGESIVDDLFRKHGMHVPHPIHLAHSFSVVLGLLQQTDFLGIFPWPLIEVNIVRENVRALPLREVVAETIVSVTSRRGAPISSAGACFIECLRDAVREDSQSRDRNRRRLFHSIDLLF